MGYRNAEPTTNDQHLERLKRKRDQHWDMAGLARQDGDQKSAEEHTRKARDYAQQIKEYLA